MLSTGGIKMKRSISVFAFLLIMIVHGLVSGMERASYVIKINNSSQYYLWLRAKIIGSGSGQISATIDSGSAINFSVNNNSAYQWLRSTTSFVLNYGSHRIDLSAPLLNIAIDKIVLTSDANYTPSGTGPPAEPPKSIPQVARVINLNGKGGTLIIGDATGDGTPDFIVTSSQYLSVYDNSGVLLWQKQIAGQNLDYVGDGCNPCRPIDIDSDGAPEIVGIVAINDTAYLAALDGMTGEVKTKYYLPALTTTYYYDAFQIANLRGLATPQDVYIKSAEHGYVPFNLSAYKFENGQFQKMWEFVSEPGETRAGCHRPKPVDIDEDGADEILFGHWVLEEDGSVRWAKPFGYFDDKTHIDSQRGGDIIPSLPGKEIAYASGSLVLDMNGNEVWRQAIVEGQSVAIAEMRPDLPGLEVLIAYQEPYNDERLFDAAGNQLYFADGPTQFAASYETYPIQWIGDDGRESVRQEWGRDRSPCIYDEFNNLVVRLFPEYDYGEIGYRPCDILGDYREELVCFNENYIVIYQNIAPNSRSLPSPWLDPAYRESHYNWVYY